MINIEDTDKKVKQVDGLLTSITNLIKKHWLLLLFILIIAFGYWAWNLPPEPVEEPVAIEEEVHEEEQPVETEEEVIEEEPVTTEEEQPVE